MDFNYISSFFFQFISYNKDNITNLFTILYIYFNMALNPFKQLTLLFIRPVKHLHSDSFISSFNIFLFHFELQLRSHYVLFVIQTTTLRKMLIAIKNVLSYHYNIQLVVPYIIALVYYH
jgi:hypothetical protein